jgi:phage terminase large subunit-like protein
MTHNKQRALEPIEFIQMLTHTGDFHGQQFTLLDWQYQTLWDVYGTVDERGLRQYRYAYLEIPKKNGKTELTAAIAVYHLFCDKADGRIYCCAADKLQAGEVYHAAKSMIEQNDELAAMCKIVDSQKTIINRSTGTFMRVLSSESKTKHGLNPTVVIFDELHAQPNRLLWDVMTFGAGAARKEPIWWVITTAGDDPDRKSIGWEIHEYAQKVRDGVIKDPSWFVKIYGAPEDADIWDEATWFAANPSLGHSIPIEAVRQEALTARNSAAVEKNFRWLRLNQWVALKRIGWLPITLWDETVGDWNAADLHKKKCYAGIDLSSKIDLTAVDLLFPPQDGMDDWRFIINAWVPEDNMKEREARDHVAYGDRVKGNWLNATPGDVVDYPYIRNAIEKMEMDFDVQFYFADPWQLEVLRQFLPEKIQNKFIEVSQSMAGMSQGMGELERLFRAKQITHEANPLGRWCFGNVIVAKDGNENIKPMKNKSIDRIDPIVALVDAMAGAVKLEKKTPVYETRGMRSLA